MNSSLPPDQAEAFGRMMRLGQACYSQGARKQAHRYWRRAALVDPGRESVWLALMQVVETEEDRRVCLQNILAINPRNRVALKQMEARGTRSEQAFQGEVINAIWPVIWSMALSILIALAIIAFRFLKL
jgi:hypothetical protein